MALLTACASAALCAHLRHRARPWRFDSKVREQLWHIPKSLFSLHSEDTLTGYDPRYPGS
jgi:hypothetical protein